MFSIPHVYDGISYVNSYQWEKETLKVRYKIALVDLYYSGSLTLIGTLPKTTNAQWELPRMSSHLQISHSSPGVYSNAETIFDNHLSSVKNPSVNQHVLSSILFTKDIKVYYYLPALILVSLIHCPALQRNTSPQKSVYGQSH